MTDSEMLEQYRALAREMSVLRRQLEDTELLEQGRQRTGTRCVARDARNRLQARIGAV